MRLLAVLLAAGGASAVPFAEREIVVAQTVSLSAEFLGSLGGKFDALETAVVSGLTLVKRAEVTVEGGQRRMQAATDNAVTISYYVDCGAPGRLRAGAGGGVTSRSCNEVFAKLNDPHTLAAHAAAIVDAVTGVAAASGFADAVIGDVNAAEIAAPLFVDISPWVRADQGQFWHVPPPSPPTTGSTGR